MITKIINFFSPLSKIILVLALGTFAYFQAVVIPNMQAETRLIASLHSGDNVKILGGGLSSGSNAVVKGEQDQKEPNQLSDTNFNTTQTDNLNNFSEGTSLFSFAKIVDPSPSFANYTYISGDLIIKKDTRMLRIKPNAIDSEKIRWHAIEADDIDTGSITSRTIRNHTIQGEDINPETVITAGAMGLSGNLDMQSNLILNIGNAGTDFTNTGGLTLAGNLTVNGAGTNYFAGKVGIGTASPAGLLDVNGKLTVLDNGNIGIGTTAPSTKLFVYGSIGIQQNNLNTDGVIWKNNGYSKISAAIKPIDNTTWARQGLGFYTGNDSDNSTDAQLRMAILRNGNVGIGTVTPTANLQVAQGTAGVGTVSVGAGETAWTGVGTQFLNTFKVGDNIISEGQTLAILTISSNTALTTAAVGAAISAKAYTLAGGTRFSVLGNGNVGIGTTGPASLLDVTGGLTTVGSVLTLGTKETSVVANDVLGRLNFYAPLDAAGTDANAIAASIVAISEGTFSATSNATSLQFRTGASEIATTKMTILSNGNVGIGTTSPGVQLDVQVNGAASTINMRAGGFGSFLHGQRSQGTITSPTVNTSNNSLLVLSGGGYNGSSWTVESAVIRLRSENTWSATSNPTYIQFNTTAVDATSVSERLRITSSGNVGIGITNPTALLHLNGSAGKVSLEINSNEVVGGATNNVLMLRSDVVSADDPIFRVQANGLVYADGAYTNPGADYAEYFYTEDSNLKSGEAVCVDVQNDNAVKRCQNSGDNNIMGIVSTKPSIIGNKNSNQENDPDHYKVIGMIGQVSGLISNENGNINIGDSLTSASLKGYLRKANAGESTVGVAMQDFSKITGTIQILISRRNQSLTVEKVEEAVTQNIANMNIQDQVDNIVAKAKTNLDQQMASQTQDIASLQKLNINLQEQIDDIKSALYVERYNELWNFYLVFKPESLENIVFKENGNFNLLDGKITAESIEAIGTVKAQDIITDTLTMKENKTSGKGVILAGETELTIDTPEASENAKISITAKGSSNGKILYFDEIEEGQSFKVKIDAPALVDEDINFVWLIVK